MLSLFLQSCLTLCDLMDCSPPGSSVHGILQARILEWDAISFSRGYCSPRNLSCISCILALQADSSPLWLPGKPCGSSSSSETCTVVVRTACPRGGRQQ